MFTWAVQILQASTRKISQLKYALGIAGVAAAVAISAILLQGYFSSIGGVIIAVNMGVMLMVALLMFVAAVKARGRAGEPYRKLYFLIACAFSFVLVISALLSLSSVFFGFPLDIIAIAKEPPVEPSIDGDYRIEESVIVFDLRKRQSVAGRPGAESKESKMRIDRVVRQRPTDVPFEIKSGTNGLRVEQFQSPTHPSMTTEEVFPKFFPLTTKHSYTSSIPSDRFPIGEPVTVQMSSVFVNAFTGEDNEWAGASSDIHTSVLTLIVLFPKDKPCKEALAMEKPMGSNPVPYRGTTKPVLQGDGSMVTWTIVKPIKGNGYFIAFKW
jgi:hypothetical protein